MEFIQFPKIARFNREIIVTEKIDGTNAQIYITENGDFYAGSRTRWITPHDDNFGFAKWAYDHQYELMQLGPGRHFGEWWGLGIQRNYGMQEKHFSLFNVDRWAESRPECCHVVPVIWRGLFQEFQALPIMDMLEQNGSYAAPGFMKPEGIVVYHKAGNLAFKKTFEKDDSGKYDR